MKNLFFTTVIAIILLGQAANGQSFETTKKHQNLDYLLTAQQSAVKNHAATLDRIQQETEDLILSVIPASVVSLAKMIHEKFPASKGRKSKTKLKTTNC